jgi:hypothetical protein
MGSPFRQPYFLAATLVLGMIVAFSVFILATARVNLDAALSLIAGIIFLIPPWVLAFRIYSQIRALLMREHPDTLNRRPDFDMLVSATSSMIGVGLGFSFAAALCFLSALSAMVRFP